MERFSWILHVGELQSQRTSDMKQEMQEISRVGTEGRKRGGRKEGREEKRER